LNQLANRFPQFADGGIDTGEALAFVFESARFKVSGLSHQLFPSKATSCAVVCTVACNRATSSMGAPITIFGFVASSFFRNRLVCLPA
jgi:hypothetical protein